MRNTENTAPDRNAPIAWIVAAMSVVAAWAAFGTFKSGSAEWTVVVPLFAPGAVFVPVAVEVRSRFGDAALAGFTAAAAAAAAFIAGPSLLTGMDIGGGPGFQWVPGILFGVPFAAVAFVGHRLAVRRWFGVACDLPIAIVVFLGVTVLSFAMIVVMLIVSLPRIG
jgi:hypothetical protein